MFNLSRSHQQVTHTVLTVYNSTMQCMTILPLLSSVYTSVWVWFACGSWGCSTSSCYRPQEIDEAARRRLVKRLYIPLPDSPARRQIVSNLLREQAHSLSMEELEEICGTTDGSCCSLCRLQTHVLQPTSPAPGYSGADMANLCREAAYGPVREAAESIQHISAEEVHGIVQYCWKNYKYYTGVLFSSDASSPVQGFPGSIRDRKTKCVSSGPWPLRGVEQTVWMWEEMTMIATYIGHHHYNRRCIISAFCSWKAHNYSNTVFINPQA